MSKIVFLGGTCGNNHWRDEVIHALTKLGIDRSHLFNPVVPDWNEEAQRIEDAKKVEAAYLMFYIADPKDNSLPLSMYGLVEATMALYDDPHRTVVVFDDEGLSGHPLKAQIKIRKELTKRFPAANILPNKQAAVDWLYGRLSVPFRG